MSDFGVTIVDRNEADFAVVVVAGGAGGSLDDLSDVDLTGAAPGDVLTTLDGTEWTAGPPSGGGLVAHDETVVGSDVTANSATWATLTGYEVTIAASAGDVVDLLLACYPNAFSAGGQIAFDIGTIVAAAVVNRISGGTGNSDHGCLEAFQTSSAGGAVYGAGLSRRYVVQAGDVDGGQVLFRGLYRNPVGNCTVTGSANFRSLIQATNLGAVA